MKICQICGREFNNLRSLTNHIARTEKITTKNYYDKYLLKNNENLCYCGNNNTFINMKRGYRKHCSKKCSANDLNVREKYEKSNLKLFGCKYPIQNKKIQNKIKKTNIIRYNKKFYSQTDEYNKKIKNTCIYKYGVDHYSKTEKSKEKHKCSYLKNLGYENPSQSPEVKLKKEQTYFNKTGYKNSFCNPKIIKKRNSNNLKNFGYEYPLQSPKIKQKVIESFRKTFYNNLFITNRLQNKVIPLFNLEEYIGIENKYPWKCLECNTEFEDNIDNGKIPRCLNCYPKLSGSSLIEKDVVKFCKQYYPDLIENDRIQIKPKELDIYIPKIKLAIEFHGLYWHSELQGKDKNYHLNKYLECKSKGIKLIQIFEDEWDNKKEIIKNIILNKFGKLSNKIDINVCNIREINDEFNEFLENNHINGSINSDINIGLYYNNELVSLLSINKIENNSYVISRFCNKINYNISDSFSKLFNYFKDKYLPTNTNIYSDLRYDEGYNYINLGFKFKLQIDPTYYSIDNKIWNCGYDIYTFKL